jgi:hypothetical protein
MKEKIVRLEDYDFSDLVCMIAKSEKKIVDLKQEVKCLKIIIAQMINQSDVFKLKGKINKGSLQSDFDGNNIPSKIESIDYLISRMIEEDLI